MGTECHGPREKSGLIPSRLRSCCHFQAWEGHEESHFHRGEFHSCIEFKMLQNDCEVRKIQYRLEVTLVHVQGHKVWM